MNIMSPIEGLHHVTAVARDPQTNLDFYRNILGQRLVKRTVNFDDPGTYHFYFADAAGTPGSVLTFFPWQGITRGLRGSGAANALAYNVPEASLGFWQKHLRRHGLQNESTEQRFGADVLAFDDPDGLRFELARVRGKASDGVSGIGNGFGLQPVSFVEALTQTGLVAVLAQRSHLGADNLRHEQFDRIRADINDGSPRERHASLKQVAG